MSTTTTTRLQPPTNDPPITEAGGQHSQAWAGYFQGVADQLATLQAKVRKGVTDGSDAAAGDIGEYLTATSGAVPLTNIRAGQCGIGQSDGGRLGRTRQRGVRGGQWHALVLRCWHRRARYVQQRDIPISGAEHRHHHGDAALQRDSDDDGVGCSRGRVYRHRVGDGRHQGEAG